MLNHDLQELISYLRFQNVFIDFEEFKFQLETHPDYPSLLSFSDTLNFFNIPNIAAKISIESIDELPSSFITLFNDDGNLSLYHIIKKEDFFLYNKKGGKIKLNKKSLSEIWNDYILIIEKPENIKKTHSQNISFNSLFFILSFLLLCVIYFFSSSFLSIFFGVFTFLGIFLSIEALKTELGINSKISESFCNVLPNADCGQVINSNKNKWLKTIKISDISIWFFTSQIFILFLFSITLKVNVFFFYMLVILICSIPMTFFSLYFQKKIEKKWCPICLSIIGVIYIQIIFLFFIKKSILIDIYSLLILFIGFFFTAFLVYFIKQFFLEFKKIKEDYIKSSRFSKNYHIFKNLLLESNAVSFKKENIILGNPNSQKKISIITNPFCGHCEEAHRIVKNIFINHSNNLSISIRFIFSSDLNDNIKNLFIKLVEIHHDNGDLAFIDALDYWFQNKSLQDWHSKYGFPHNKYFSEIELTSIGNENLENNLNFTPAIFLNQFSYPIIYDRTHLEYFILDWLEDEEI